MLTIRFARVGKKNRPQFKIMLQEHTIAPGGTHVEVLGSYDPHSKKAVLKEERIKYWVSQGAQVSDTAYNLFLKQGVLTGEKRKVKIPAKKVEEIVAETPVNPKPEEAKAEAAAVAVPAAETKKDEKTEEEVPKSEEKKPAAAEAKADKEVAAEAPIAAKAEEVKVETPETPKAEAVMPVAEAKKEEKTEEVKTE